MFKKDLIDLILAGKKTMTSRDKKLCEVGEITNLMADKDYSKISGKNIRITKVHQKSLSKFTDVDARLAILGTNAFFHFSSIWQTEKLQHLWIEQDEALLKQEEEAKAEMKKKVKKIVAFAFLSFSLSPFFVLPCFLRDK